MSKYTTELRYICEKAYGLEESADFSMVDTITNASRVQYDIFSSYPIFDEAYRPVLQSKILQHYYTQEICEETVGLWKLRLAARMREIMPYYNQLYKSELIEINPLYNVDYTREGNRDGETTDRGNENRVAGGNDRTTDTDHTVRESSGSSETTREAGQWDLFSDTPQGGIDGILAAEGSLAGNGYLTNARHTYGDGKSDVTENSDETEETRNGTSRTDYGRTDTMNNSHNGTSAEEYLEHVYGYQGRSPVTSLLEFRETFLNIDLMIINDLQDLFMGVW